MGLFSTSPKEHAQNARAHAEVIIREFQETNNELRHIDSALKVLGELAGENPPKVPVGVVKDLENTLLITRRHAVELHRQVIKIEDHLKKIQKNT